MPASRAELGRTEIAGVARGLEDPDTLLHRDARTAKREQQASARLSRSHGTRQRGYPRIGSR